ncbi:MAG TPA: hypothetical protein VFR81_06335 [Longimicrobium sp.]|nr:hypothetical protein [Longimicrobium sp.]
MREDRGRLPGEGSARFAAPGIVAALLFLLLAWGCGPGGGGTIQVAPETVRAGEAAMVQLELSVWGAGGDVRGRYTELAAFYRLVGEPAFREVTPTLVSGDERSERYRIVIPPYPRGTRGEIEYYIDVKLDGHASRIEGIRRIAVV